MNLLTTIILSVLLTLLVGGVTILVMGYLLAKALETFVRGWARFFNIDR